MSHTSVSVVCRLVIKGTREETGGHGCHSCSGKCSTASASASCTARHLPDPVHASLKVMRSTLFCRFGSQCSFGCSLCSVLGGPVWAEGKLTTSRRKHPALVVASDTIGHDGDVEDGVASVRKDMLFGVIRAKTLGADPRTVQRLRVETSSDVQRPTMSEGQKKSSSTSSSEPLSFKTVAHRGAIATCRQKRNICQQASVCCAVAPSGSQHEGYCLQPNDGFV